jgi:hypothetical protein
MCQVRWDIFVTASAEVKEGLRKKWLCLSSVAKNVISAKGCY